MKCYYFMSIRLILFSILIIFFSHICSVIPSLGAVHYLNLKKGEGIYFMGIQYRADEDTEIRIEFLKNGTISEEVKKGNFVKEIKKGTHVNFMGVNHKAEEDSLIRVKVLKDGKVVEELLKGKIIREIGGKTKK